MKTKGIDAITLFVEDLETSKAFYRDAFDLQVVFEDEDSAVFDFQSSVVNLLKRSAVTELIGPAQMAPRDAGSRVVLHPRGRRRGRGLCKLTSSGVELLNGPMDRPWGIRTASIRDPDGYIWEVARKIDTSGRP